MISSSGQEKESQSSNSSSLELWISSENPPEGWKTTKSLPNKYLGDSGRIFPDKISALHFLISEHYKPEDNFNRIKLFVHTNIQSNWPKCLH